MQPRNVDYRGAPALAQPHGASAGDPATKGPAARARTIRGAATWSMIWHMPTLRITASALLPAPPAVVYGLIADYRRGHPSILPPAYFEDLTIEAGGQGAGTRIRFTMKAFGSRQVSRAYVTEPDPGRVLVETVEGSGIVTTFTVTPAPDQAAHVVLATDYPTRGLRGWVETLVVPRYLKKVYAEELRLLGQRAAEAARSGAA